MLRHHATFSSPTRIRLAITAALSAVQPMIAPCARTISGIACLQAGKWLAVVSSTSRHK